MSPTLAWINVLTVKALKSSPDAVSPPATGGESHKYRIASALAGAVNGLFGGGGGIPLLVLLTKWGHMEEKTAFATCVAVIFPLCAVSATVFFLKGNIPLTRALPYLVGGLAGGWIGGRFFRKVPNIWLRRIFALFLFYGAWRYLTT